jgi:tricorn protease
MAGSGGDLMPYMFRYRKIGTLVGKRTWGGLVHTADTPPFVDGGSILYLVGSDTRRSWTYGH